MRFSLSVLALTALPFTPVPIISFGNPEPIHRLPTHFGDDAGKTLSDYLHQLGD